MTVLTRIGAQNDILGESPIWDEQAQALYWIDIRQPAIRRWDYASGRIDTRTMPGLVGSIAFAGAGHLLVALGEQVALYDWAAGTLHKLAGTPTSIPGHRFNDGRCDRQGRFWVGTMHNVTRAPEGVLYRLDPDLGLVGVLTGISIPNSLAWSPDGRTMYFADSLQYTIFAYEFDPESSRMGRRSVFATTEPPGFPDGSTVDADGFLWNAEFNASRVVRYAPDGRIDRVIELPVDRPTCCAFGGPGLDILFVTTTSQNMTAAEREAHPLAGALLAFDAGARGIPEPSCISAPKDPASPVGIAMR
jgi:sugar lactone lactonase YvrE